MVSGPTRGIQPLFTAQVDDDASVTAMINTTPLVDVMLVLLIIFLITIPVVTHNITLSLPKARNVPREVAPQHIQLAVDVQGDVYWNGQRLNRAELIPRLQTVAQAQPQPEVHIHGDEGARYDKVGQVVWACQQAGLVKLHFVTEPPVGGGR